MSHAGPSEPGAFGDRVAGAVLGTFLGDALGEPFQFLEPSYESGTRLGAALANPPLRYTDDTQMALVLAAHLGSDGEVTPRLLAGEFLAAYDPERGYGRGMMELFDVWGLGADLTSAGRSVFPDGSFGNGAAMRIGPLGAFFARRPEKLSAQVHLASEFTHAHPVGTDGALVQAVAVAMAARTGRFGPSELADLIRVAVTAAVKAGLRCAAALAGRASRPDPHEVALLLGNDITADRSVPTALYLAATSSDLLDGIGRALDIGGDADTIAAMTGAVLGAETGLSRFPHDVLDLLEDEEHGRTYAVQVAATLAARAEPEPGRYAP